MKPIDSKTVSLGKHVTEKMNQSYEVTLYEINEKDYITLTNRTNNKMIFLDAETLEKMLK